MLNTLQSVYHVDVIDHRLFAGNELYISIMQAIQNIVLVYVQFISLQG